MCEDGEEKLKVSERCPLILAFFQRNAGFA
jgi:hypothetical protein